MNIPRIEHDRFRHSFPYPPTREAYQQIADFLATLNVTLTVIWSVNPVERRLILVAYSGGDLSRMIRVIPWDSSLTGLATDSRRTERIRDVRHGMPPRSFFLPELIDKYGLGPMVSVPILNRGNPHQVLFVLDLFPAKSWTQEDEDRLAIFLAETPPGEYIELCLQQECLRASNRMIYSANTQADGARSFRSMCRLLARTISDRVACSSTAVFVESADGGSLDMLGFWGEIQEMVSSYDMFERAARQSWERNREFLVAPAQSNKVGAEEMTAAVVPLRDAPGFSRGTIVAFCPDRKRRSYSFSYEDIAVIESLGNAFATRLEILLTERRRETTMARLTHEMRVPITAFHAAIERIQEETKLRGWEFEHDYIGDLAVYAETMQRNVREMRLVQQDIKHTKTKFQLTLFEKSILRPACRFAEPQLEERGFDPKRIVVNPLHSIPALYLDRVLMTQVVFNLIENGIKFAKEDPGEFRIVVSAAIDGKYYEISFRDWGVGVPKGFDERIFQEGTRGPSAWQHDVLGDGLGLYVARQFTRLHGGDLEYRRHEEFTEFVIRFPRLLKDEPFG
jgi:signal transduction histidine kinase